MKGSRWIVAVLVALIVFLVAALLLSLVHDGGDSTDAEGDAGPRIVTAAQLSEFAAETHTPVYWLGERPGSRLELTETSPGSTYIRYLGGDAEAGDPRAKFVTIATYPEKDGVKSIEEAAIEGGSIEKARNGATLLLDPAVPKSVYLAFPGEPAQIEIYSPLAGVAKRLASGKLPQQVR